MCWAEFSSAAQRTRGSAHFQRDFQRFKKRRFAPPLSKRRGSQWALSLASVTTPPRALLAAGRCPGVFHSQKLAWLVRASRLVVQTARLPSRASASRVGFGCSKASFALFRQPTMQTSLAKFFTGNVKKAAAASAATGETAGDGSGQGAARTAAHILNKPGLIFICL